ncbi:MAG: putative oxidoreductase YbiC [Alphaproteobacteria bacterium MarineAlpha11_Bin1]|nr:MAG: putative oxidoreductase YbiC [Alphaproteobacteria bacterium MarineAlpha11_Bin1]|tara:strand:- start:2649 stop:3695 length:1047 start_codon:yes stop_codon:yes gene_type:complete
MRIDADNLKLKIIAIFEAMGSQTQEAVLVANSLVQANLKGHDSHGVGLVATYISHFENGLLTPNTEVRLIRDDGAILMFDGGRGFGPRVAGDAMDRAIERCAETGVVLMTIRNAHHIGRVGAYGDIAIAEGLISIHFVNVTDHSPTVAPWGGAEPRFVTNPVCIAIPGTENTPPTMLDMATSKIALGKARVAMSKGEKLGPNLVIDNMGLPSTDPSVVYDNPRGSLLPFGDYKGSGLALMCELLAGGLSGGGTIQPGNPRQESIVNNMFTVLVDPERLVDVDWLRAEIDATVAYVKSARPTVTERQVMVAGDPERVCIIERTADGITLNDEAWEELRAAAQRVGASID